jgi:hypothetical protein
MLNGLDLWPSIGREHSNSGAAASERLEKYVLVDQIHAGMRRLKDVRIEGKYVTEMGTGGLCTASDQYLVAIVRC